MIRLATVIGATMTGPASANLLESQTSVTSRAAAISARLASATSELRSARPFSAWTP